MDDVFENGSEADFDFNTCRCNDMSAKDYSKTYAIYNLVVAMIILPTVALFGIFSNMANIFIFTRPSFISSPSNIFLLALSFSDFFIVLTGLFLFCSDSARVYFPALTRVATEGVLCILPLGYIAQTCSVYFTLAAAVDCYTKVRPRTVVSCTMACAKAAAFFVTLFSLAYNMPRFWQFELHDCYDEHVNQSNTEVCPTPLYHHIEVVYNVYMYMILMTALPFVSLGILNILILRNVHRRRKKFSRLRTPLRRERGVEASTNNSLMRVCSRARDSGDDGVVTMIMVVVMFLACNTLALVVNIVETFFEPDVLVVQFMTDTSNLLVVFNSSVNFVIYMLFDKPYASEFFRLLCGNRTGAMQIVDENMNSETVDDMTVESSKNRYGEKYQMQRKLHGKTRRDRSRQLSLSLWRQPNKYSNADLVRDVTMEQLVNGNAEKVEV